MTKKVFKTTTKLSLFVLLSFAFIISASMAQADVWTEDASSIYTTNTSKNVGIGTDSPTHEIHAKSDAGGVDPYMFEGFNGAWGERDVFTIKDDDWNAPGQDESSLLKVLRSKNWHDNSEGSALVELTYSATLPSVDNRHFYILGRTENDEGEVSWGVSLNNADFWTKGDFNGGVTGIDCGGSGADCFSSPTYKLSASGDSYINGGNLGIGTDSPTEALHVVGSIAATTSTHYYTVGSFLKGENNGQLILSGSPDATGVYHAGVSVGRHGSSDYNSYLSFNTETKSTADTSNTSTEKIRITNTGNVGIGTSSPSTKLDVDGNAQFGSNSVIDLDEDSARGRIRLFATSARSKELRIMNANGYGSIGMVSNEPLVFNTNNTERVRIDNSGNVGIGTSSPSTKLDVDGNINASGTICDSTGCIGSSSGSADNLGNHTATQNIELDNNWLSGDGDDEGIYVANGGKVGIGTSSLSTDFEVNGKSAFTQTGDKWTIYATSATAQDDEGAIYAEATDTGAHNTVGIWGVTNGSGNSSGQPIGVRGDAVDDSPTEGQYGVLGYNWATTQTSGMQGAGVFGGSLGVPGAEGEYTGRGHGVQGETYASSKDSAGGIFYARHTTGGADAISAYQSSTGTDAFAIYGSGDSLVTGSKSAGVYTETQGPTAFYSEESTEIHFTDYGQGQLENGSTIIELDSLFLETITIDENNPLHIFTQSYGNAVLAVEPYDKSFKVYKISGSDENVKFSYRVVAKRKYYENQRLDSTNVVIDQFMRPDLTQDELRSINEQWGLDYSIIENVTPGLSPIITN